MADSDDIDQLKAILEVYKRHHAECCAISTEARDSVARELLVLTQTTQTELPLPSQPQEHTSSLPSGLQIVLFDPLRSDNRKARSVGLGPSKKKQKCKKDWEAAAELFLSEAPKTRQWNDKAVGIESSMLSRSTCARIGHLVKTTRGGSVTIIDRAEHHAKEAAVLLNKASTSLADARIYLLCLFTYFHLLEAKRLVDHETIVHMMTLVAGVEGDTYTKRIWDGAAWMSKDLMKGLVEAGWTWAQATTLCRFCAPYQPYRYAHINHPKSLAHILNELTKEEYLPPNDAVCVTRTIPEVVAAWEPAIGLQSAREILGYDQANDEQRQNKRKMQLATNERPITSSTPPAFTLATTENASRQDEDGHMGLDSESDPSTMSLVTGNVQQNTSDSGGSWNTVNLFPDPGVVEGRALGIDCRPHSSPGLVDKVYNFESEAEKSNQEPIMALSARRLRPHSLLPIATEVPDTAPSIQFAIQGNIAGLIHLFCEGLASPRDVSHSRRFSLVRWALYGGMHNFKTVQFLLDCGALVDEESYQHVWDYAYRRKCSTAELIELQCITLNPNGKYKYRDWIEEQRFPDIHNIIIGRSKKPLWVELNDNPDAIKSKDAIGRTALDWATCLAELPAMRLLIERKSPLNTMDASGRTMVLHAVDSHNDEALRIVLEAGADPNPKMAKGQFRSSPLTAASFGGLMKMAELLIRYGAKVDACNPEGYSPLTRAITNNNHAMLKLFVDRGVSSCSEKLQLSPMLAQSANAETMAILASSDLLEQTPPNGHGLVTSREIIQ